jgi:hypothetical protein
MIGVIEKITKNGTEWGISLTNNNPEPEDYFPMDKDVAYRLEKRLKNRKTKTMEEPPKKLIRIGRVWRNDKGSIGCAYP